VSCYCKS